MFNEMNYKQVDWIILLTLCVTPLTFLPLKSFFDFYYLPKVLMMTLFVVWYLLVLLRERKQIGEYLSFDAINKVLLTYFFLLIISVFLAQDKNLAIYGSEYREEGIMTIALYMVLFLAGRRFSKKENIYEFILMTGSLVAVYGILQHFGYDPFPRDAFRTNWTGTFSTMGNPNFLGTYLVLMLPISMHVFISKNKNHFLLVYATLFYCLLATRTRGAWLGAIVGIISYVSLSLKFNKNQKKTIKRIVVLFFISLMLMVVFNYESENEAIKRFASISTDLTTTLKGGAPAEKAGSFRIFIWKRVLELIKMKPWFGHGIENLGLVFSQYYADEILAVTGRHGIADKAHNEYLHIAVTSGIPALLFYLSFITLVIKKGFKNLKERPQYFMPLLAGVFAYLVQAFFNISIVAVVYVFWIFLGMLSTEKKSFLK